MRAVLLAAGLGSRLKPLTDTVPKCLAPICGRPLLAYWLDALLGDAQMERVLVNTHHLAGEVERFVRSSPWSGRIDLAHEPRLLGTAGTLNAHRDWIGAEAVFVAHADNFTDAAPLRLIDAHRRAAPDVVASLFAFRTPTPRSCGILELDARNHVVAFHEKVQDPPGNLANGAVYVFEPDVLARIAALGRAVCDLSTEVIPGLLPRVLAVEHTGLFMDIGTPAALVEAQGALRSARTGLAVARRPESA